MNCLSCSRPQPQLFLCHKILIIVIYLIVVLAGKQSVNIALSLFLLCLLALVGRYLVAVALFKRNLYYLESAVIVIEISSYILSSVADMPFFL